MEKASLTETTAHLARLLKKGEQMNDHHEVGEEEFGSGSGSGSGPGSGSGSGSGSGPGPDPEKTAVVALAHVVRNSLLTFDGVFDE